MSVCELPDNWKILKKVPDDHYSTNEAFRRKEEFDFIQQDLKFAAEAKKKRERTKVVKNYDLYNGIIVGNTDSIDDHVMDIAKLVGKHVTEVAPGMSGAYPTVRIKFNKDNEANFVKECGVPLNDIVTAIKSSDAIKENFQILNNPFIIALSCLIHYHYKKKTMIKVGVSKENPSGTIEFGLFLTIYMGIKFYRSAYGVSWKYFEPRADIMEAAMNDLTSNRLSIKKYKNMFGVVKYISEHQYNSFAEYLEDPFDSNITQYITNLTTRIRSVVKKIAEAYYKYQKEGIGQSTDQDMLEGEDGDMYLNDNIENISKTISATTRKYFTSFCNEITVNPKALSLACKLTSIGYDKTTITINSIINSKEEMIEDLMRNMFSYFFLNGGKKIKSKEFLSMMEKIFSVSNSIDPNINKAKDLLHTIMTKYSKEYVKTNNVSTISNMKKTLFFYIVFYVAYLD
jgi:hypothetical protein